MAAISGKQISKPEQLKQTKPPEKAAALEPLSEQQKRQIARQGQQLMRLTEAGKGLSLQLIWPNNSRARQEVFQHKLCLGMVPILVNSKNQVFRQKDMKGKPWWPSKRYSSTGHQLSWWSMEHKAIAHKHSLDRVQPAYLLPVRAQSDLFTALATLQGISPTSQVSGTYQLIDKRLWLTKVSVDNNPQENIPVSKKC